MFDLFVCISDFMRPILFIALLMYVPMKIGIGFDIAFKAPTSNEIRESRDYLVKNIFKGSILAVFYMPFRLLAISYFTVWLLVDKNPWLVAALFFLTLTPVYFA